MQDLSLYINGVQLADGNPFGLGVVEEWDPEGEREIDTSKRIRAGAPEFFDMLTYSQSLKFSIFRQHETQRAALDHEVSHGRALPGVGSFAIQLTEDGVIWQAEWSGCAFRNHKPKHLGVSTEFLYSVEFAGAATITEDDGSGAVTASYLDGLTYLGTYPNRGVLDGGHYFDTGFPVELSVDGGSYV